MRRLLVGIAAIAASGCFHGDAGAPAPAPAAEPKSTAPMKPYDELEGRMPALLDAFDVLAKALTAADSDCGKIASALRAWGVDHSSELDELTAIRAKLTPAELEHFELEHSEDIKRIKPIFELSLDQCRGDREVNAALDIAGFRKVKARPPRRPSP